MDSERRNDRKSFHRGILSSHITLGVTVREANPSFLLGNIINPLERLDSRPIAVQNVAM